MYQRCMRKLDVNHLYLQIHKDCHQPTTYTWGIWQKNISSLVKSDERNDSIQRPGAYSLLVHQGRALVRKRVLISVFLEKEPNVRNKALMFIEKEFHVFWRCFPWNRIGAHFGKGTLIGMCVLTNRGGCWKRGAYWYVRAYSIGALVGMCMLTQ